MGGLFVLGLFTLIGFSLYTTTNDALQGLDGGDTQKAQVNAWESELPGIWDWMFIFVYIGFFIVVIAVSYFVDTNPIFFIVFILMFGIFAAFAGYLANTFIDVTESGVLAASAANFTFFPFILNNYIGFILLPILAALVTFFAKPSYGGYY